MKKVLIAGLAVLLSLGLSACDTDIDPSSPDPTDISSSGSDSTDSSSSDDEDEFKLVPSDNGLTLEQESYTITTAAEGDENPPTAVMRMSSDEDTWHGARYYVADIKSQDQSVIPDEALSFSITFEQVAGFPTITGFTISVDRTRIGVGTTRILFNPTICEGFVEGDPILTDIEATLCFEVNVVEYGAIEVETYDVDATLDITGLSDAIASWGETPASIVWYFRDTASERDVYGTSADYERTVEIDIDSYQDGDILRMDDVRYAVGHTYQIWIQATSTSSTSFRSIPVRAADDSEDGPFTFEESSGDIAVITVTGDATLELVLDIDSD